MDNSAERLGGTAVEDPVHTGGAKAGSRLAGDVDHLPPPERPLRHLAIIPDGNRRWARRRGLPPEAGHEQGFLVVTPVVLDTLWNAGIETTTLWLFSTENWSRPEQETTALMKIYQQLIEWLVPVAKERSVKVQHMGRTDRIPSQLWQQIQQAQQDTSEATQFTVNLALDYGGEDEIIRAVRQLLRNQSDPAEVTKTRLLQSLQEAAPVSDPDLIVRTSGEWRLSGFMPLRSSYSELWFTPTLFPDMSPALLADAITHYHTRQRRFGG